MWGRTFFGGYPLPIIRIFAAAHHPSDPCPWPIFHQMPPYPHPTNPQAPIPLSFPTTIGCEYVACCQYLLIWKFNVWATISTIVHLPRMFLRMDFCFETQIGLASMDLLCIILTYYTQDDKQECFRLSNSFSLRCLGPWMNHLAPVWWSDFRFIFLNKSWCVSLT